MTEEECSICGSELLTKFTHTLSCGHTFHYECLSKTFVCSMAPGSHKNCCPYCRQNIGHLPLVNGLKKVLPHIHCKMAGSNLVGGNLATLKADLDLHYSNRCDHVLLRGKNKGTCCMKHTLLGYDKCKAHFTPVNLITDSGSSVEIDTIETVSS